MNVIVNLFDIVRFGILALLAVFALILFLIALIIDFCNKRQAKKIADAFKDEEEDP